MESVFMYLGWIAFTGAGALLLWRISKSASINAEYNHLKRVNAELEEENKTLHTDSTKLRDSLARMETQFLEANKRIEEQKKTYDEARTQLEHSFKALASEALSHNSESFLKLASERLDKKTTEAKSTFEAKVTDFQKLIEPIRDTLTKVKTDLESVEKSRNEQFGRISEQLLNVAQSSENLRKEASSLTTALRRPEVRGSWGELQLKRVVELAGMSSYCDFEEQVSVSSDTGLQKPDMLVHLPNDRVLIVDSKAVLDAFLEAVEAQDPEAKNQALLRHARNIRSRVSALSKKSYWDQFEKAPDFAVLFIPNEALLAAAVEVDRNIIEDALSDKIVIATPTTLVALLKAVAYGWQQDKVAENAMKVIEAAKEFHERLQPWMMHLAQTGEKLQSAVKSYNATVGSLESRVLPSVRRFRELGLEGKEELISVEPVEIQAREPKSAIEAE